MARFGVRPPKLLQYPGLKEEYYLHDFEPDRSVPDQLGVDNDRTLVVVRTPPDVSLYHRRSNPLFPQLLAHLGSHDRVHAVVVPRSPGQRDYVRSMALPSVIVPERAVDAQSLIAFADLVVSAGGTMNREAAALGVPVYTTYGGRIGGVDEMLIREGRLRPLTDPRALELRKRNGRSERVRRNPRLLLQLLLAARAPLQPRTAGLEPKSARISCRRRKGWRQGSGSRRSSPLAISSTATRCPASRTGSGPTRDTVAVTTTMMTTAADAAGVSRWS